MVNWTEIGASMERLFILGVGLIALIVGGLWLWRTWQNICAEPDIGPQPDCLTSPPSDLSPAMVHLVCKSWLFNKGKNSTDSNTQLIMATLVDLAHQGVISLEVISEPVPWAERILELHPEKIVKIKDLGKKAKYEFENFLVKRLAGDLIWTVDQFKKRLGMESVSLGFFEEEPFQAQDRMRIRGLAVWGVALLAILSVIIFWVLKTNDWIILLPFVGLGIVGVVTQFLMAPRMPKRTRQGVREAALWSAFGNHLREISQPGDMNRDFLDRWNSYLPYAIAFDLHHHWINRLAEMHTMNPQDFYPGTCHVFRAESGKRPFTLNTVKDTYSDLFSAISELVTSRVSVLSMVAIVLTSSVKASIGPPYDR